MLALTASLIALSISLAQAAVSPLTPATVREGSPLTVQWTPDTTGTWTNVSVALMSGSNWEMNLVAPIADGVDGTATPGSYEWTVPDVSPNSGIYFLQFTNNGANPTWTTRFAIASASGETTPPTETIQPDGQSIPWGIGALEGSEPAAPSRPAAGGVASGSASGSMLASSVNSVMSSASSVAASAVSSTASAMSSASSSSEEMESSASSSRAPVSARPQSDASATPTVAPTSSAGQLQVAGLGLAVAVVVGLLA